MRSIRKKRKQLNSNLIILKKISKILFLAIIILSIIYIYKINNYKNININKLANNNTNEIIEIENNSTSDIPEISNIHENTDTTTKSTTINMAFTGDIMCHNTIYKDAFDSSNNTYNFSYIFDDIKYHLQTPDILIGNLETTFAGSNKGYSSYPTFNTPEALAYNLKKLGFDVLSTANNHCYDKGYSGLESTINYLDNADISHTGTYKSADEQNSILIKNVKGINIAFLSFTYGINGFNIPSDKSYCVNLIDKELITSQLNLAKEQNPDLICVSMHWGVEYQTSPNSEQKDLADFLFTNGADIIIGNHPHVIQPMEKRQITLDDGTLKDVFVIYSLGNFIADQNKKYTKDSAILNLKIQKNEDGKINIESTKYTPIYTFKDTTKSTHKFKIIDLNLAISNYNEGFDTSIGSTFYKLFSTELNNIKSILEK